MSTLKLKGECIMTNRLVGKPAPHFIMNTALGNGVDFGKVSLEEYKGKWVVLFFYPLDFTFVCPTEIRGFSEEIERFKSLHTEVIGVSTDSIHSHRAWMNTPISDNGIGTLNFPLASDITKKVSDQYGVLIEEEGIALRGLFIIDPEGILRYQLVSDNNVGRNVEEVLRVLEALQSGGLCPLNWKKGDALL